MMTGDFLSLRLLIVSAFRPVRELWRQGAALASVPIECAESEISDALGHLGKDAVDIVLFDAALSDADRDAIVKRAREIKPAPFIGMFGSGSALKPEGVDTALPAPRNVDEAQKLVERCTRSRLPTRVLIVDDSSTMRSIVRKILGASRYTLHVSEAEEGMAALKTLESGRVDLVLLDYNMPGFNGFETLTEIKRLAPAVAVVMMTTTVTDAMAARAESEGALAFLKKPFYPADIDAVLARYFS